MLNIIYIKFSYLFILFFHYVIHIILLVFLEHIGAQRCYISLCYFLFVLGMTTVTLHGSEWLSFSLYESNNRVHSPTNRVSLDFKVGAHVHRSLICGSGAT